MNLHGIVSGYISAVNPQETVVVEISDGYETAADGLRSPKYLPPELMLAQVQALQFRDIQQLDGLNIQGTQRKMYFYGEIDGLVRVDNKGGDLITRSDGSVWLVTLVLEQWPDWCSVAVTLQDQKRQC